jgi:glycosyltransferase involved in cell wall biosynthesis
LQDALERLVVDVSLASRLGEHARLSVKEKYSAATVSGSYIDLFREVTPAYAGRELEAKSSS